MLKRLLALLLALALLLPLCALADEQSSGPVAVDLAGEAVVTKRILTIGCRGADVLALQNRLNHYGYYTSKMDSVFGGDLKRAVTTFQTANGLKADGKAGPLTIALANSENAVSYADYTKTFTLSYGSHGENVKELQRYLRNTYFYAGKIDGIFGADVNTAVKNFQAACGLTVDGKVGKATKNALYNGEGYVFSGAPIRQLRAGSRGYDVYVLQQKLASLNYLSSYTAGYFDTETTAALMKFEKANGLKETGIYGSTLRRYLYPTDVYVAERQYEQTLGTEDDPYERRTLKLGMYGSDVSSLQMQLKAGGYLLGNADGIFGEKTLAAVKRLQKDVGIKQDGIVGSQTWRYALMLNVQNAETEVVDPEKPAPAVASGVTKLRRGSRGANVTKLQGQLITLGYMEEGSADGKFGPLTAEALMAFQKKAGITVDGVAGSQTFAALNEALGNQWIFLGN